jgi:phage replisome organizer, putative, N-terminal region
MRERKYVKFRVDMYADTKFKIIDMKPERDVIHYIWSRIVLLAGKVNLQGELFLSKNIPYTIETFAIEFNRSIDQIKLALEVFIELQMIEVTEDNIYKVKNFAKHQNIKVKEKEITEHKVVNIDATNNDDSKTDDLIEVKSSVDNLQKDSNILFDVKKARKRNKKKKIEVLDEEIMDEEENGFVDGDRPLGKNENIVSQWSFG